MSGYVSRISYASLIIATLCWGGNTVAGKLALGHVSPMVLTFVRWVIAVTIIVAVSLPALKRDWPVLRRHLPLLAFYGVMGFTFFNALLYTALKYTTTINVAIEQAGIPMLIFALNFLLFRTRVSLAQVAGFSLTLVGVALTAAHGDLHSLLKLALNYGDGLMLGAVALYAIYTVALRYKPAVDWRSLMALPAGFALLSALPLMLWEMAEGNAILPDPTGWAVIAYTAIFPSLVAQVLYIKGVEGLGPNRAGLFINLVPVFGTLMSILVLGEDLQTFHVIALVLSLGGIAIAEIGRPRDMAAAPAASHESPES